MKTSKPSNWQAFTLPTQAETRKFLTDFSDADNALAENMWDSSTGLRGLLTARRLASVRMNRPKDEKDFVYDQVTEKYRNAVTGRVLSEKQLRNAVARVSNEAQKRMKEQTRQLIAGTIMFVVWYARSRNIMKALYKTIWVLWLGGFLFDDETQRDLFYLLMLMQFKRFDNFTTALDSGAQKLNGTAVTRAGSYGRYGNTLHQNMKLDRGIMRGHTEARRVLGMNELHCHDYTTKKTHEFTPGCVELAERGWMPISQMIPLGGATCRCITTPNSRILTDGGWKNFYEIQIGDFVLTHKLRWRQVTAKIIKPSQPEHKQVFIQSPTGAWVGATDSHLWFTEDGWQNSSYIYNLNSMVYNMVNISNLKVDHEKTMSEMQEAISKSNGRGLLSEMSPALTVSLRESERPSGEGMYVVWSKNVSQKTMGYSEYQKQDEDCFRKVGARAACSIRGHKSGYCMDKEGGWSDVHKVLGRPKEKMEFYIPLPMGLDTGAWRDSEGYFNTSHQPHFIGRHAGELGSTGYSQTLEVALRGKVGETKRDVESTHMPELQSLFFCSNTQRQKPNPLLFEMQTRTSVDKNVSYMSELWERISQQKQSRMLFEKMPLGTPLYDITVSEDHSFCLEGLFSHNSNCLCSIETRRRPHYT